MPGESINSAQLANVTATAGGFFAGAWSAAAESYQTAVAAAEANGVVSALEKQTMLAAALSSKIEQAAANASTWAQAAMENGDRGVGIIMQKYADKFADQAAGLANDLANSEGALANTIADANQAVLAAEAAGGNAAGKLMGPIIDAAQMIAGATQWAITGDSTSFGQACGGVLLGATLGALAGLGVAVLGIPAIAGAVVVGVAAGIGSLFGGDVYDWFNKISQPGWEWIFDHLGLNPTLSTEFGAAQTWSPPPVHFDPLTLDLDGDGIEVATTSSTNPLLFDVNADGIKTSTAWVKSDDGLLVFDRNGNGTIDNGTELFGDSTSLASGANAADGFAALAQEDSNHDGKVDSQDANWNQLRVWRDLNQDGTSQADELFTLDQAGIAGIGTDSTSHSQTLTDGSRIGDLGSFTRTDGSTGTMGDVDLAQDTFFRAFTDDVPVTDAVAALPDMQGSGKVRDLQQAASQSAGLQDLLAQYSQATTRAAQLALLDQLLDAWADTSGLVEHIQDRGGFAYSIAYQAFGSDTRMVSSPLGQVQNPDWVNIQASWEQKLHILEAFNGRYFFTLPNETQEGDSASFGMGTTSGSGGIAQINISLSQNARNDAIYRLYARYS